MNSKKASILASEEYTLKSVNTGRTYRISISLPYPYASEGELMWPFDNPLKKWPVVYLLDANWNFGMVTDVVRSMSWYGTTNEAIVVGIGYQEDQNPTSSWLEAVVQRAIDFTPVRDEGYEKNYGGVFGRTVVTGDADNFHKFIKEELIAMIEENYNADPSRRILAGQSLGGLFGTYALFKEPELFDNYIIGSPFLQFGNKFMLRHEEAFSKENTELNAKAYFTIGENEEQAGDPMVSDYVQFVANLEKSNYNGFTMLKQMFSNLNHTEVIAPGFQAGLKWALGK